MSRRRICGLLLVALACGLAGLQLRQVANAAEKTAPIGVAKTDITPDWPVRMYGYGARKLESEGIAGRLMAKALALGGDEGEGPAVLLAVDLGAVPWEIRGEVLRRVQAQEPLKGERFVLSHSHCHSGPDLKGMASLSGSEREHLEKYARVLTDRLVQVVLEALAKRQEATLAWAEGRVGFAANRRVLKDGTWSGFGAVPNAPADHSLPVLCVTDKGGKVFAIVANYACHTTTLRGDFKQIHGDWSACAQEYIEADHPGAVALITIGCGADADPYPHGTVQLCQQHGRALAAEVKRLLQGPLQPISPQLAVRAAELEVPYLALPPMEELEKRAKNSYPLQWLLEQIRRNEKPPASQKYPIAVWAFGGDLTMVFLSNEVVVDYALRMKKELALPRLWVTAYADDVSTYIVSQRLIGEGGYEVRNSLSTLVTYGQPELLRPAMEDRIIEQVRRLLPHMP